MTVHLHGNLSCGCVQVIDMAGCQFSGQLPLSFAFLYVLRELSLAHNR